MKLSVKDIFLQLFVRKIVIGPFLHECGHLLTGAMLGVIGEYRSYDLTHVYWLDVTTRRQGILINAGGGLFEAFCFLLLNIGNNDNDNRVINNVVIISSIIYGLAEPFSKGFRWIWAGIGLLVGGLYLIYKILDSEIVM